MIHTSVNIFEASKRDKPQYFVDKVKDKRRTKNNNLEFLIGWRGFPDPKDDTWEPLGHLSGSEHMIREFNEQWEKDYVRKTVETLEDQTVRRNFCDNKYFPWKDNALGYLLMELKSFYVEPLREKRKTRMDKSSLVAIWTNSWV